MTNVEIVAKKLAYLEDCVRELTARARPSAFANDIVQRRFAEHTLQLALQAAIDVASHIVSDERLGEPKTNADLFRALVRHCVVPPELEQQLVKMAGFRNVLVHGYVDVDVELLETVVRERLGDLLSFAGAVRAHMMI